MDANLLNEMLDRRVKELAARGGEVPAGERRTRMLQALGLDPLPPRTELNARVTGVIQREGYRIEKIRYESRPGLLVTAHLYLPDAEGKHPVVLNPHGHWQHKKSTPWVQARGASLALAGFAALIVDSPGFSWDDNPYNERRGLGPHDDWFLNMGAPVQGIYVWDLMRGLDYLETRPECDTSRVGITGCSGGATATMWAFAVDERIKAAVPVCYIASFENSTTDGCLCNHVADFLLLGDRNDILAMRAPAPVMVIGATVDHDFPAEGTKLAFEKLAKAYRQQRAEGNLRLVMVEANHDYNRRMREAMLAFFRQHLMGEPARDHYAEARPLTDGTDRPYPAGTLPAESEELLVTGPDERQTISMRDVLRRNLLEPYPAEYSVPKRLVRWSRYGKVMPIDAGAIVAIHDATVEQAKEPGSMAMDLAAVDQRKAIYCGLSVPELAAQILHLSLPGAPDDWEASGVLGADAFTSMIASVKTLVGPSSAGEPPRMIVAEGPICSMVAHFLKVLRPEIEVQATHRWKSWQEIVDFNLPQLAQPAARYLQFPALP